MDVVFEIKMVVSGAEKRLNNYSQETPLDNVAFRRLRQVIYIGIADTTNAVADSFYDYVTNTDDLTLTPLPQPAMPHD